MLDTGCDVLGEGQTANLVVDHRRLYSSLDERGQGAYKAVAVTDDSAGPQNEVLREDGDTGVARSLRLARFVFAISGDDGFNA
ncbi:hypothetical protein ACFVRT_00855 [Arthrobacter koreensis]|uniref:hypothetical protein n=1 Tax=Arthrobacter koreensis TaxID=199136 RepID=UPI002DBC4555|nr:hypothetical protein [Arthrobacter koreensis]MEB7449313.1 hypothetical protein [Arthrobacter koreensis]